MRGNPIIQWFCFAVLWLALALPIARVVTGDVRLPAPDRPETTLVETWIRLHFSSTPGSFVVRQDGEVLWKVEAPSGRVHENTLMLSYDAFGAELRVEADLGQDETAVEIQLEPDGRAARSRTVWGSGRLDETVTFTWSQDE